MGVEKVSVLDRWGNDRIVERDACSKYVSGAEVAAWEALLEMEFLAAKGGENATAAATLVVTLANAFKKVQLIVIWQCASYSRFPERVLTVLRGYFAHERRLRYKDSFSEPLRSVAACQDRRGRSCCQGLLCRMR